jgi:hypothetical protein
MLLQLLALSLALGAGASDVGEFNDCMFYKSTTDMIFLIYNLSLNLTWQ